MDRRIASLMIAPLLSALLLSSCGGAQAVTSPTALPPVPGQPSAIVGATPAAPRSLPATAAPSATAAPAALPTNTASAAATAAPPAATPEAAVAPEQNPVGDIPDTQAFVAYSATPGGYALDVPEGWARSTDAANVRFVSKLDGLSVTITAATAAPTAASARDHEVAALIAAGRVMTVSSVDDATLPVGSAVLVKSSANSDPDPVTNKQVRLEQNIYLFFKDGKLATLTLWAPLGADNVDQWQRIATSFRWT
ncbi:MAG: hypothetical protein ABI901_00270 [Roseiflexaceae bacterium]